MKGTIKDYKDACNMICPVCGYYCLGTGGNDCINKYKFLEGVVKMGFSLKSFFEELEKILEKPMNANKKIEKLKTEIAWHKAYAKDCKVLE